MQDRHPVACPPNHAMSQWHINWPSNTTLRVNYTCAAVRLGGCLALSTPWNSTGNWATETRHLERHHVQCPQDWLLTSWRLHAAYTQMRMNYTCCAIAGGLPMQLWACVCMLSQQRVSAPQAPGCSHCMSCPPPSLHTPSLHAAQKFRLVGETRVRGPCPRRPHVRRQRACPCSATVAIRAS